MKKQDDADTQRGSGLFIGSEPIKGVYDRSASGKDDDDSKDKPLGDTGDDDSRDSDKMDSDTTDGGDREDSRDSDGKD